MKSRLRMFAFCAIVLAGTSGIVRAKQDAPPQEPPASAPASAQPSLEGGALNVGPKRVLDLLRRGDVSMWGLVLCSIITVTFVLERLIVLRSGRVIPRTFVNRFVDRLRDGELDRGKAREMCRENGSPIAKIFLIVVNHSGQPASEIRQAVNEGAQSELFHLRRRVRALNGIATLGPLLGLFGTVLGMIEAFQALSQQAGAGKTELLAKGISLALVATASGLCVAIVSATSYYFLLGRVDRLVQEMDVFVNEVVDLLCSGAKPAEKPAVRPRVVPSREQASV